MDDILGSRDDARPSFDPPATRLMRWADAVRRGAGRPEGTALDVILGAVAGARAALETGEPPGLDIEVESMLQAQPSRTAPRSGHRPDPGRRAGTGTRSPAGRHRQSFAGVLSAASAIARRTTARAVIGPRHLLAAALTTTAIPSGVATALGGGSAELRERLHTAIVEHHHDDDLPAWDAIFDPGELVNDYRSDHVAVRRPWLDRSTRTPLEDDFDLENYVSMMAGMIARRTTAMPVSIGLFGEWGSGKSYFMELVKQRVDQLRTDPAGTATYCSQIVQISFNAWNYADTNLWASLASEFLHQLGAKETDPDDDQGPRSAGPCARTTRSARNSTRSRQRPRHEARNCAKATPRRCSSARNEAASWTARSSMRCWPTRRSMPT